VQPGIESPLAGVAPDPDAPVVAHVVLATPMPDFSAPWQLKGALTTSFA